LVRCDLLPIMPFDSLTYSAPCFPDVRLLDDYLLEPQANGTPSPYSNTDAEARKDLYKSLSGGHIRKEHALKACYLRRLTSLRAGLVELSDGVAAKPQTLPLQRNQLARLKGEYEFRMRHFHDCYKHAPTLTDSFDLTHPGKEILSTIAARPLPHEKEGKKRKTEVPADEDE
jgi:hypothetical protein